MIATYFLDSIVDKNIIPKVVRADRGTENSLLSGIQPSLRQRHTDGLSGEKSFMYGRSTSNQRIEAYWAQLRRSFSHFYMNLFKDMINEGLFDNSNDMHIELIRYCFMNLIQKKLDENTRLWNSHNIRESKNSDGPFGKPEILYQVPELCNSKEKVSK